MVAVALAAAAVRDAFVPTDASAQPPRLCVPPLIPCPRAPQPQPAPAPPPLATPKPALDLGMTESDPRLLDTRPKRFPATRLAALKPRYVRVLVDWNRVQPRRNLRPNWNAPGGGCPHRKPRCKSLGLRSLLESIRARSQADGGWQVVVVPYFTPRWAARPKVGCERRGTTAKARMPRIAYYRRFLRRVQALGDELRLKLAYWTPWNEPNHPAFLNPQRQRCSTSSPALAPALYAQLARAAAKELRAGQQLVIGELAGLTRSKATSSSVSEFTRALPSDVACGARAFAQHAYIGEPGRHGRAPLRVDPAAAVRNTTAIVDSVDSALRSHGCQLPLWISEAGTFDHRCEAMAAALGAWARDPRVQAAFQFTFREATAFPVGLVSHSLRRTYGSYRAWRAFAGAAGEIPQRPCG